MKESILTKETLIRNYFAKTVSGVISNISFSIGDNPDVIKAKYFIKGKEKEELIELSELFYNLPNGNCEQFTE